MLGTYNSASRPGVIISTSARPQRRFRTPARLLTAVATALSLMSALPAQAATTSHVSATASPLTVLTHSTVTIAGKVTPRGNGVVNLQRYTGGKWVQLSHKTASRTGSYAFAIKTSGTVATTIYRVTRNASGGAKAAVSRTQHVHVVKTAYKVKAAGRPTVALGSPIVVTGSVSPKVKGSVRLEVLQHGKWNSIATAKLSAASTYSLSKVEPTGVYAVRVRSPLTTTIASGVSSAVKVTVTAAAAPTASVSLAGTVVSAGQYSGTVTASAHVAAASGVKSTTYVLDGSAAKPYTAPVAVASVGAHTFKVTVTDAIGRVASATSTWTSSAASTGTTRPTVAVSLAGSHYTGTVYGGPLTVTIAATDTGSGIKSVTYSLDGAAAAAYTAPFVVSTLQAHTLGVTATDKANNVTTAPTTSWSQIAPDTTPPTANVGLSGNKNGNGDYVTAVTATVTAADNAGGSGIAAVTYSLDGLAQTAYTGRIVVPATATGHHILNVTATDGAGHPVQASATWTQTTSVPDNTAPTPAIALLGNGSGSNYSGTVVVTVSATDAGAGVDFITYKLDGGSPVTVSSDSTSFSVAAVGSHTVTLIATDLAGNSSSQISKTWNESVGAALPLLITSIDQATLGLPTARLAFSTYRGGPVPPARVFTLTNTTGTDIAVSGLTISGADASSFRLSATQPTGFTVPANSSAQVSLEFHPTDPTGCPTTGAPTAIGDVNRDANLVLTTNAAGEGTATADLSGINACYLGGNDEPVLEQVLSGLGYTDKTYNGFDHRYTGPSRFIGNTDEIISPYFTSADGGAVTLTPIAHYGAPNTAAGGYVPPGFQRTGWYAKGAAMDPVRSTCNASCKPLWTFDPDFNTVGDSTSYNENQLLLPTPTGTTSFTPTSPFGLFSGDFTDVNYSDDSLNVGHQNSGSGHTQDADLPVPHYLHDMRIYPAYGPGRVPIPNTYIVGIDLSRVPAYKNNDYQDVVLLLSNVTPAVPQGNTSNQVVNLTGGVNISGTCTGTFAGTLGSCDTSKIATTASGLQLTSSGTGQLATHDQVNALYRTFDASRGAFTISTRVIGSTNQLQHDYQQIGAFFGPDDSHFIKIEAEHNTNPGLTLFWDEDGTGTSAASVPYTPAFGAALTSASTLDLVIKGNTNVPDPLPYGDAYGVHGFPLDQLTVWYSIDGGTLTQIGPTIEMPKDVTGWFSRTAKAGILVASPGAGNPITATFSQFSIVNG